MERPALPAATVARVTESLALWLARGWPAAAADVSGWDGAHWRAALWVAYWQGAIPLWAERLSEMRQPAFLSHFADLPSPEQIAAFSRRRTERLLDELQVLIDGLHADGVEIAPLKGARLAPFYYAPMTLRALGDIDVLIRPADLSRATAWLQSRGWTFYSRSAEDVVYLRGTRRCEVWHPDNVLPLELHFRLREEFGGAGLSWDLSEDVWRSASRQPYLRTETYLVAPVVLLRHLCAHASSDMFVRRGKLQQLADIARVARTLMPAAWQEFAAGLPARYARFVYPALALTARYDGDAVPPEVLSALRASLSPRLRAWCDAATLSAVSESNPEARDGLGLPLARLLAASGGETAYALLRSLLPPRWNLMKRYPRLAASPAYPLCYVLLNADRAWQISRRLLGRAAAPGNS